MSEVRQIHSPHFRENRKRGFKRHLIDDETYPAFDSYLDEESTNTETVLTIPNIHPPLHFDDVKIINMT